MLKKQNGLYFLVFCTTSEGLLERAMGIEPTALAWEARVLPLYDARAVLILRGL